MEGGFNCAMDLVAYIRENYGTFFSVGVAGYPEVGGVWFIWICLVMGVMVAVAG